MDPQETFRRFVDRALEPGKARRFISLSGTKKGQGKILVGLAHEFEHAILPTAVKAKDYAPFWATPCFVYYQPLGFGIGFDSVRVAYGEVDLSDSWLILMIDASAGIHRPENRWDAEKLIIP